jgi:apolipoprotein N-acyltransferase
LTAATARPGRWPGWALAGLGGSAALFGLYAVGGDWAWPLGFVMLVPWLLVLDPVRSHRAALLQGLAMAMATTLAGFHWFGAALGDYLGLGTVAGIALLLLAAPLLQPQWLAFALLRQALRQRHGPALAALAAAAAWVGTETLLPKLLGDTLGHGLAPSALLRQAADLGGAAGLSVVLLLVNEALAQALRRRTAGARGWLPPLAWALLLPLLLAGYGAWRLNQLAHPPTEPAASLRVALVQASQIDYERRRRETDAYTVVREVLDAHYALSMTAIRDHGADALLWPETVYPTPFGAPRSADGAGFDAEIQAFVDAMGVPLLFGSYEVDAAGEYNAAILLEPEHGRLASYRKTYPFPLTEYVPAWLDSPWLRRSLPWTGSWLQGNGARVLPLRSRDGREVQVLPLICLDATRPQLALDGARLGAQAIVGLSNDSWFTRWPAGARLHLAVARFRSIETRLPQLRATNNGLSALIDATGAVPVQTAMGQQAVLTGSIAARDPPPTLMVAWGDWVGRAALGFLALLALGLGWWRWGRSRLAALPASLEVHVLSPSMRAAWAALRLIAALGLVGSAGLMALRYGWQVQALTQFGVFALAVVLPLLAAAVLARLSRARLDIEAGMLRITQAGQRIEIPLAAIRALHPWRWPLPSYGVDLVLRSGTHWALRLDRPEALQALLARHAVALDEPRGFAAALTRFAEARGRVRHRWIDHAGLKFGLFPLLPAFVAFRLHQLIVFGGPLGEWQAFGAGAWLSGLALWWGAWALGLMLIAAVLRLAVETTALAAQALHPQAGMAWREGAEAAARLAFYAGIPAWLGLRLLLV